MAAKQKKEKKTVRRGTFPAGTKQVWKVSKEYIWGFGWRLVNKNDVLKEGTEVSLRLDIKDLSKTPLLGEVWEVTVLSWRQTEGDIDAHGKPIIYIEGVLEQKVARAKKTTKSPKRGAFPTPKTETKDTKKHAPKTGVTTDILPFRDPAKPSDVLYMKVTFSDGKIISKRLLRTATLESYLTAGANNLREIIKGVLTNPYKGIKKTKGIIEKYSQGPLEEVITLPPFLTA